MPERIARVERMEVSAYTVPTDQPEADGTLEWSSTTLVLVELSGGGNKGLGYTYTDPAAAHLIHHSFRDLICGADIFSNAAVWQQLQRESRNIGRPGLVAHALSAVDTALWDLKARFIGVSLVDLLGSVRARIPVYGSGGFTNYSDAQLDQQINAWIDQGLRKIKIKVGAEPKRDPERVRRTRAAIGPEVELFVDANGALTRKDALHFAELFRDMGVSWFEEPVSSDDLEGLAWLRAHGPAGLAIAAGEYGSVLSDFHRLLEAQAVDVLQADITRCQGLTGLLQVSALCAAHSRPLSAHTAPALHVPAGCALIPMIHLEYFHDHVRIENLFFDGIPKPINGCLSSDRSATGLGLHFKRQDVQKYRVL